MSLARTEVATGQSGAASLAVGKIYKHMRGPCRYRVAKPVSDKSDSRFWTVRARVNRQLFPSETIIVAKNGNTVAKDRKVNGGGGARGMARRAKARAQAEKKAHTKKRLRSRLRRTWASAT